jgi:class 3 adenylate cyclase/tetratricopeptide (TPR) repeat protein
MDEREQLEQAIAALEGQRVNLGDAAVEAAQQGLRQRLLAITQAEAERRVITILFCDVKGSTALAERLDPEEWAGIMNRAYERLIVPVQKHEGKVVRLLGDAILAFFGAPMTHEDDPQRAVLAGLEMVENIRSFREELRHEHGLDFDVRVGINTGLTVVGEAGSAAHGEYTAMGDAVNLAARMEQTARPGTVQITAQVYQLVAHLFDVEPLGPIEVKGKSQPVLAYRVIALKAKAGRMRGLESHGLHAALVGRQAELSPLQQRIGRLLEGHGGIAAIIGEAGLGKTRLVAEAREAIPAGALLWLEGNALSFGQSISYWPFQEMLRRYAGIGDDDGHADAWHKLERGIRDLFPQDPLDILPYLASLLTLNVDLTGEVGERLRYLDSEGLRKQIFLSSRRFFAQLARTRPLVLVFEDVHWMDASSARLLEHLLPLVERVPMLVIALSRPEPDTPAAQLREITVRDYAALYTEIQLTPLSRADSAQLAQGLLGIERLPQRVQDALVSRSEGNPFFIEEVVRTMIDTGAVVRDPATGGWRTTASIETLDIPHSIRGVILARIDRLGEEARQVLRVASVVGRSFLYRLLKAVDEADQQLDRHLDVLRQVDLIREKTRTPELEYMFRHALAQEVTYESILLQKRRELHACIGKTIETLFTDRLVEFYGLLAYHFARAEVWEKAQGYLLKAGDQAGRMAADAEALAYYDQATNAYARAFGDRWDPVQRASLHRKMGEAFHRRGEHQRALDYLEQALKDLGRPASPSRWATVRELVQQVASLVRPGLPHERRPTPPDRAAEEEFLIYQTMGWIDVNNNSQRMMYDVLRALNLSEQTGYADGIAFGSIGIGYFLGGLGHAGLAMRSYRRGFAVGMQSQHLGTIAFVHLGFLLHHHAQAEWDLAIENGLRAIEIYRQSGDIHGQGTALLMMAQVCGYLSQFDRALTYADEVLRLGQDTGDQQLIAFALQELGFIKRRMGYPSDASEHLRQGVQLSDAIPDYMTRMRVGSELGRCYIDQGLLPQAIAELEESRRIRAERNLHTFAVTPLRHGLAEAYLRMAEQVQGTERRQWLAKAKTACQAAFKQTRAFRGGISEAYRLQGTYGWLMGKPDAARRWWQRSLAYAQDLNLRYDEALTHLEIGRLMGDTEHTDKGVTGLAAIGVSRTGVTAK